MKSLINKTNGSLFLIACMAGLLSACTLGDVSEELNNQELSAEEIEAASQILGNSLSDDNDGIFSSLNDALSTVSSSGFEDNGRFKSHDDDDHRGDHRRNDYSGRGGERNYEYNYDPETGTHTLSFDREVMAENFQKSMSAVLTYIFTNVDGDFIAAPRINSESIENIDFTSSKSGSVMSRFRDSEFSRADTFSITGVSDASTFLTIDGTHYGNGTFSGVTRDGDTFSRSFVNEINFLDIVINKDTVAAYGNLAQGVTGTLTYDLNIFRTNNGEESGKNVSGTIEMDGDGTALLRFKNINRLFKVNLRSGFVTDDEDELESNVIAVDTLNQTVTLRDDLVVVITDRTEIEGDDGLDSLEDVFRALENNFTVKAEVEGYRNPQNRSEFIADEIEFEMDGDDDSDDDDDDDD